MLWLSIVLYAMWSGVFSLAKLALLYSPPIFLTGFRMLLAGFLLLLYLVFFKKTALFSMKKKDWISISLLAFLSIYLTNVLEFWGLQYLSASKACFVYSLSPFFAAFFSYLHFKEQMTGRKWLGMGLGVASLLPVLYLQTEGEKGLNLIAFLSWPSLAMIGAALFSVYGWVLLRVVIKEHNLSPLVANGGSMFLGGSMALLHSFFIDSWNPLPVAALHFPPFLGWTLLMTALSNLLCYNLYTFLLKRLTATLLSFVGLVSPLFASLHAWILLGEPLSPMIFLSTALLGTALWIVYSAELSQGYVGR